MEVLSIGKFNACNIQILQQWGLALKFLKYIVCVDLCV